MVRACENIYRLRVTEYEMAGLAGIKRLRKWMNLIFVQKACMKDKIAHESDGKDKLE